MPPNKTTTEIKVYHRKSKISKSVDLSSKSETVVQIVLWYLDSDCSKHMTGQRTQLTNFVSKFLLEGLGHNLFSVGQFYDSDLEVAFRKHTCFIRDLEGVNLLKGTRGSNLSTLSLENMMQASPICLLLNNVWSEAPLFVWAEEVMTAYYTQNRSVIRKRHNKTPYELLHDRKPDLSYLHVFGALCYPTNDSEDIEKLQPKANIGIFVVFDEYFKPRSVDPIVHEVPTPVLDISTGSPSSTSIDQDAPSASASQTTKETQPPVIQSRVE
ncbi:integrase, catalytic region, zinc finger, CCHC-type containing protein [Tanacetum coccineum]